MQQEAQRAQKAQSRHVLTPEDAELFAAALDAPPTPTPRALEAARNYRARGSCRLIYLPSESNHSIRRGTTVAISTDDARNVVGLRSF